jgi:ribosomal protein L37AE/L43A
MSETESTSHINAPVEIDPTILCHDCNSIMDEARTGIWICPSCGVTATVQTTAEVIDDGA